MSQATLVSRLLFTLVAPLVVYLMGRIPLVGVDVSAVAGLDPFMDVTNLSVGALGIMPYISAAAVVEMAALVVPRWRPLREDSEGRLTLTRATVVLSVLLALFQAYGILQFIRSIEMWAMDSGAMVVLSLSAGFCITLLTAALVSARGIINGVVALWLSGWAIGVGRDMVGWVAIAPEASAVAPVHAMALYGIAIAVIAGATVAIGRAGAVDTDGGERQQGGPYRGRAARRRALALIPVPACGIVAVHQTMALIALPTSLESLGLAWRWEAGQLEIYAMGAVLAVVFTLLFHWPRRVIEAWGTSEEALRRARWPAIATSVAFTLLLLSVTSITGDQKVFVGSTLVAVLGAALVDAWRHAQVPATMGPLRVYHRAYEAEAARARLEREGLVTHLKDLHTRTMFHFFGPFVPIVLWVRHEEKERAREVLDGEAEPLDPKPARWWPPLLVCAAAWAVLFGADRGLEAAFALPPVPPGPPAELQLMTVADELDWMEGLTTAEGYPDVVRFEIENVPLGTGHSEPRFYAVYPRPDLNPEVVRWFDERVPAGHVVRWGRVYELDERTSSYEPSAWRSYLLHERVWLEGAHVEDAVATTDVDGYNQGWFVNIVLTEEGGRVFEDLTRTNVHRRIAIVVDGVVVSAPEVREPITGGTVRVTMGAGPIDSQREDARQLADGLLRAR